jgi:hypothetical protein
MDDVEVVNELAAKHLYEYFLYLFDPFFNCLLKLGWPPSSFLLFPDGTEWGRGGE